MEGEEGYGNNGDVPFPRPSTEPEDKNIPGREQIRRDQYQFGSAPNTNVAPLQSHNQFGSAPSTNVALLTSHNQYGGAPNTVPLPFQSNNLFVRAPRVVVTPSQSTSNMLKNGTTNVELPPRLPPSTLRNPSTKQPRSTSISTIFVVQRPSILRRDYSVPPRQLPVVPYQQGTAMNTQQHSAMNPFSLMGSSSTASLPLPAPTQPHSNDRHGAKRLLPPHLAAAYNEPGRKRQYHNPIVDNPNQPPLLRLNPNAHPIGRGVQPASISVVGRFQATRTVAIRPSGSSPASIPGRFSTDNQRERLNLGGRSHNIAPPANQGSLEQRLTAAGKSLSLGNLVAELVRLSRQRPDIALPNSGTNRFQNLRSSSAQDGSTSLPPHALHPQGPAENPQANTTLDSYEECYLNIDTNSSEGSTEDCDLNIDTNPESGLENSSPQSGK